MIPIRKASEEMEMYSGAKLLRSFRRAGAPHALAKEIRDRVEKELSPNMTTEDLFMKASTHLLKEDPVVAAKYSLKRAIMDLGPAGFLFEQYVAAILREYGFRTKLNQIMEGRCTTHEIDVLAEKGNEHFLIEAKYHNERGIKSDIKTIMYTYARLLDIEEVQRETEEKKFSHRAWLFTNTKLTSKAAAFGRCRGIWMTGWRHPRGEGLEALIETKGLYPVTILPAVDQEVRERFAEAKLLFVRDLRGFTAERLVKELGITPKKAVALASQAGLFQAELDKRKNGSQNILAGSGAMVY